MLRLGWLIWSSILVNLACSTTTAPPPAPAAKSPLAAAPTGAAPSASAPQAPAPAPVADGGVIHWPGSRVSLWAPQEMRRPTRLQYLRQDEPLVIVALAELTGEDATETKAMLAGARQGGSLSDETPVARGSAHGFSGHAKPDETGLSRQVLALADGPAVAVVIVQYQAAGAPLVTRILDSIMLDGSAPLDPLALNGIRLGDDAGFAVRSSSSHPVLLADKGRKGPLRPGEPALSLLSLPYPKPDVSDAELGQMLATTVGTFQPFMPAAKMDSFEIAHGPAFIISAPAKRDRAPIGLYAFIVRRPDSAFAGFGHVRMSAMNEVAPRFERLVKALELDDSIISPPLVAIKKIN